MVISSSEQLISRKDHEIEEKTYKAVSKYLDNTLDNTATISAGNEIKAGKCFVFWGLDKEFNCVAVTGLGKKSKDYNEIELICQNSENIRIAASAGCKALADLGIQNIQVEDFCNADAAAQGSILGTWKYQELKTEKVPLPQVELYTHSKDKKNWLRGVIKADSQNLARKLAETPSNLLTPTIFATEAQNLFCNLGLDVKVYDKKWAEEQKMFAFLSVTQGSVEPPQFLEVTYNKGDKNEPPFVLVGKGVTFDSGGISIKSSKNMDYMRADMAGAAATVGALYGLAKLNVEANIKLLIPMVENLPSGCAIKPGDVVRARNGKTICIDNTDAEGRLILADALSYSSKFNPKWVLDIATLTGAIVVALGNAATAVYSNSDCLYKTLENAGSVTGDRVWRMPLWKHYTKMVAEYTAYDVNNIGKGCGAGSCTAAAFLREFVPDKTDWLHLDMAGVMGPDSSVPYLQAGMTGRPTRTIIEFIESQTKTSK